MRFKQIVKETLDHYVENADSPDIAKAKDTLIDIAARHRKPWLYAVSKFYDQFYPAMNNVVVSIDINADIASLRTSRTPIVYVANHVSNLDSLVLVTQFLEHDLPYPVFVAGKNLFTNWISSWRLKSAGALKFDATSWSKNPDYKVLVNSYFRALLENDVPLMVFPEGTRSRTGNLKVFKEGVLSTVLDTFFKNKLSDNPTIDDVLFVPLGLAYAKVPEDGAYVRGLSKSEQGDLMSDFSKKSVVSDPIYLHICAPVSARELFRDYVPVESNLTHVARDFAAYLRLQVRLSVPILESDIVKYAIHSLTEENGTDTLDEQSVAERTEQLILMATSNKQYVRSHKTKFSDYISRLHDSHILRKDKKRLVVKQKGLLKYYSTRFKSITHIGYT